MVYENIVSSNDISRPFFHIYQATRDPKRLLCIASYDVASRERESSIILFPL